MPPSSHEIERPSSDAPIAPSANANSAIITDSERNASRIEPREKPSARSVPISAVRDCTAAYIVFVAPKTAPTPASTARPTTIT